MRTLTIIAFAMLLAACAAETPSSHPGVIGGEQAVKNSSLAE